MGRLSAIIRQRCPRCRKGPVFEGFLKTRECCPVCDLKYEREPGYFIGAMYVSYTVSLISTGYWLPLMLLGFSPAVVIIPPLIHLIIQTPITFRYARVIWLHFDHSFDPTAGTIGQPVPSTHH